MENPNPKQPGPSQQDSKNMDVYKFYRDRCLVLGDYLDILLNRSLGSSLSKLPIFEKINYADDASNKLFSDLSKHGSSVNHAKKTLIPSVPKGVAPKDFGYFEGGILLPCQKNGVPSDPQSIDEGSGNIVIMGAAGTGKSTLAFQMAAACASKLNNGIAVYYSLEVSFPQFQRSMMREQASESQTEKPIGRGQSDGKTESGEKKERIILNQLNGFAMNTNADLDEHLGDLLERILESDGPEPNTKIIKPQVLFPSLSPCSISDDPANHDEVFLKRFKELELLLKAIRAYNENCDALLQDNSPKENPKVKMVVIDSINAFSNNVLNRQAVIRLMSLLKEYGIIGVFTLGDDGSKNIDEMVEASTIQYLADVVISLKCDHTNSYTHNYLSVTKSRYVQQVIGMHPYKINAMKGAKNLSSLLTPGIKKKLEVLPALHYRINASDKPMDSKKKAPAPDGWNLFGIDNMPKILPEHFGTRSKDLAQIITIIGGSGLFKSDIAINALLKGILENESGLIIRLSDRELFRHSGVRLSEELHKAWSPNNKELIILMKEIESELDPSAVKPYKLNLRGWKLELPTKESKNKDKQEEPRLLEVSFKSGVLYPEEMVDELLRIITRYNIKRVVLSDLKLIGVSYPFLVDSPTSGKIFLSAFLHIMRNYGIHVINTSSLSEQAASMEQINNARILSDAVLDIRQDETKENVILSGEGLVTKKNLPYYIHIGDGTAAFRFVREQMNSKKKIEKEICAESPTLNVFVVGDGEEYEKFKQAKMKESKTDQSKPNKNESVDSTQVS